MFPGDRADRDRETPMAPGFLFGAGRADSSRDADFRVPIQTSAEALARHLYVNATALIVTYPNLHNDRWISRYILALASKLAV